jgi:hypothetical protein
MADKPEEIVSSEFRIDRVSDKATRDWLRQAVRVAQHGHAVWLTVKDERVAAIVPLVWGEAIEGIAAVSRARLMKLTVRELEEMARPRDWFDVYGVERPSDTSDSSDSP